LSLLAIVLVRILESYITKGYRPEVFGGVWGLVFGDKANICVVKTARITIIIKDVKAHVGNIISNNRPIMLVKFCWQTIRARSSKAFHAFNGKKDLLRGKRLVEVVFHIFSKFVLHTLDSMLHICGVLACEQLFEIVQKGTFNVLSVIMQLPCRVLNFVNIIPPSTLISFHMEKLGVFVSIL